MLDEADDVEVDAVGADYFVWASDYPHIDASFGVVGEIRSRIATLSLEDQAKVMGLNAARFYQLDLPDNGRGTGPTTEQDLAPAER